MANAPKSNENIENKEVNPEMESPTTEENFEDFSTEQLDFMDKIKQLKDVEVPEDSSLFLVALVRKGPKGNLQANIQGKGSDIIYGLQKLTKEQSDVKQMLERVLIADFTDALASLHNQFFGDDEEETLEETQSTSGE